MADYWKKGRRAISATEAAKNFGRLVDRFLPPPTGAGQPAPTVTP